MAVALPAISFAIRLALIGSAELNHPHQTPRARWKLFWASCTSTAFGAGSRTRTDTPFSSGVWDHLVYLFQHTCKLLPPLNKSGFLFYSSSISWASVLFFLRRYTVTAVAAPQRMTIGVKIAKNFFIKLFLFSLIFLIWMRNPQNWTGFRKLMKLPEIPTSRPQYQKGPDWWLIAHNIHMKERYKTMKTFLKFLAEITGFEPMMAESNSAVITSSLYLNIINQSNYLFATL